MDQGAPGLLAGITGRGRCLLAGGIATVGCAIVLDERDLLRLGVFVAALPLLALALTAWTRRAIGVDREVVPDRLPVGTESGVTLRLSGGPLIGSMRLADTVPDAAGPQPDAPPRFTLHRLAPRVGARLRYPLHPVRRGLHLVGPLTTHVSDPLGLTELERHVPGTRQLLVLPRVTPLAGSPPALGAGEGTPGAALSHQGMGQSDVLVREYRQGDELRRVHWRSTARHDELMVRLEERPWRGAITVLLDRRDCAHRGRGAASSLEFAVELVASICVHLIKRGEPVTLVFEDGSDATAAAPGGGTGPRGADAMLDVLAAVRPSARKDLGGAGFAHGDVLAVLGATDPAQLDNLVASCPGAGHAVLLDAASWDPAATTAPAVEPAASALRRADWHVTVAGADATPRRSWDDLLHTAVRAGG
ncbi:MAG: DUF58 domain-containing protein [Pseudonocardia sp.]